MESEQSYGARFSVVWVWSEHKYNNYVYLGTDLIPFISLQDSSGHEMRVAFNMNADFDKQDRTHELFECFFIAHSNTFLICIFQSWLKNLLRKFRISACINYGISLIMPHSFEFHRSWLKNSSPFPLEWASPLSDLMGGFFLFSLLSTSFSTFFFSFLATKDVAGR